MGPLVFLIVGGLLVWAGVTGRAEAVWMALKQGGSGRPPR